MPQHGAYLGPVLYIGLSLYQQVDDLMTTLEAG